MKPPTLKTLVCAIYTRFEMASGRARTRRTSDAKIGPTGGTN
jgi:hypothetical protein